MSGRGDVRVGILGGTLDPIHVGHLETAAAARRALALTHVLVMPARVPPHRTQEPTASMFHRFAMAALAIADDPGTSVSDAELTADGPSYTWSTLERLIAKGLKRPEMFFITGADAFADIGSWYRYPAVVELANFVVVSRPGKPAGGVRARLPELSDRFRDVDPSGSDAGSCGTDTGTRIFLVDAATPDVSSTDIRSRLRAGSSIEGLVPPAVERHIRRHGLYAVNAHSGSMA